MAMPVASVDEYNGVIHRKNYVRVAFKHSRMQAEPEAEPVK
jgi:hypothetical protein